MADVTGSNLPPGAGGAQPPAGAGAAAGAGKAAGPTVKGLSPELAAKYMSLTAILNETRSLLTSLFSTLTQTVMPAWNARMQALTNAVNAETGKLKKGMCTWCLNAVQGQQQALSNQVQQLQAQLSSLTSNATTFETYVGNIINMVKSMLDTITSNM